MAKRKPKSIAKLVEEAAVLLQLIVRLKARDENGYVSCVTCGATKLYNDGMQGGHYISRKWLATKLLEENLHPQCSACNGPRRGMPNEYTLYMIDMYGRDFVDELLVLKHQSKKYYKAEILEIISEFKLRIKELESV